MAIVTNTATRQSPVLAYARLLREIHYLIAQGKGDSEEAETLADQMDSPWHAMTTQEQTRMRGLAADLHALTEGGPMRVDMTTQQVADWQRSARDAYTRGEAGDVDAALSFLRRQVPSKLPRQIIPFLQARLWDRLGDLETALLFMKEADRHDPDQALSVLVLLQQLGRADELPQYANRVIANPTSSPLDLYLAAVAFLFPTRRLNDAESAPMLRQAVPVLKRALAGYLALPPEERAESRDMDANIAQALGLGLERLGDLQSAIAVYSEAIARNSRNGELFMARGLALLDADQPRALADLIEAVRLGVAAIWPYLLLARHSLQSGTPGEALRLALAAQGQPGSAPARAEVYEAIGMALAELGQPQERVLENFDLALALDPKNERIRENRAIAATPFPQSRSGRERRPSLRQAPPLKPEGLRRARSDQVNNRTDLFNEQRRNRVSEAFVQV
jgi:tetratricopeptide (TPR) repeat protein